MFSSSKDKSITCIDWHPTIKGVVAVSCTERVSFDQRVEIASRTIMTPSLILIWSFTDPIHPQLMLEAPDDIFSFSFNPNDPNIVIGGCINGQLVVWDISEYSSRLHVQRSGPDKNKKNPLDLAGGIGSEKQSLSAPMLRFCALSAVEYSHKVPVTDIQWLPKHLEVSRTGSVVLTEGTGNTCCQIISCASDNSVLFWDIRPQPGKPSQQPQPVKGKRQAMPSTVNKFKHLDLTWKPFLRLNIPKQDSHRGGQYSPTKFSIFQMHKQDEEAAKSIAELPQEDKGIQESTSTTTQKNEVSTTSPQDQSSRGIGKTLVSITFIFQVFP